MDIKLHKQATTTPGAIQIRAEIQAAAAAVSDSELARQYGDHSALTVSRGCP